MSFSHKFVFSTQVCLIHTRSPQLIVCSILACLDGVHCLALPWQGYMPCPLLVEFVCFALFWQASCPAFIYYACRYPASVARLVFAMFTVPMALDCLPFACLHCPLAVSPLPFACHHCPLPVTLALRLSPHCPSVPSVPSGIYPILSISFSLCGFALLFTSVVAPCREAAI